MYSPPPNKLAALFVVVAILKLFLPKDLILKKHFKMHHIASLFFFGEHAHMCVYIYTFVHIINIYIALFFEITQSK